jgi:hypothetical protein
LGAGTTLFLLVWNEFIFSPEALLADVRKAILSMGVISSDI